MTKAVMRPDFLCGPSIVEEFGDLWVVLRAAERGIVVLDTGVLDPIFRADYWIFDDTVTWQLAETNEDLLRSFKSAGREIVFLSDGGSKQILGRDGRLTFSRLDVGGSSAAKRTFRCPETVPGTERRLFWRLREGACFSQPRGRRSDRKEWG